MSENVPSYDIDATVGVGINLTHDLAFSEAVNNAANAGLGDAGNPGGGISFLNTPTRLAAFGVYYDIGSKKLAMVAPQVTGPNGDIACEAPAGIADGTYYCNVKLDTSSGEYTALIETKAAEEESGKQTVASVKLFTLDGEKFTQHHTGAVCVNGIGAKLTLQKDEATGSIVLDATGDSPKIVVSKDGKSISLDISQIPSECSGGVFGVKSVTVPSSDGSSDTDIYHVIGCSDIDLSNIGLGGTTITAGDTNKLLQISGDKKNGYKLSVPAVDVGDTIKYIKVNSGSDSNVVGTGTFKNGVLTLTLDVYYA